MNYKRITKFVVFIIAFIVSTYIALVFHINDNQNEDLDKLYAELKNTETKEIAFLKLINLGEKACDYLLKKLKREDVFTKCEIIQIIAYANCSSCADALLPFLYDQHWRVRFFTIDALNSLEYKKLTSQLPEIILNDPSENVKIGAIKVMGKRGNMKDIKFLENLVVQKHLQSEKIGKAVDIALDELRSKK